MDQRPPLNKEISVKDFSEFYWLKSELVAFCRQYGVRASGGKRDLADRIQLFLETGQKYSKAKNEKARPISKFDWTNEPLSVDTLLTDNYRNTSNVRMFFEKEIGKSFKFNVKFMNWMKSNEGKTLGEAIEQWHIIKLDSKISTSPKQIAPQFEYNTYIRDFVGHNPNLDRKIGIKLWNIKRRLRGSNKYSPEDLGLLDE